MRSLWTRKRIALLKRLWADGQTATAIATRLQMSRAAVLGKVFRLRLRPAANATTAAARSNTAILSRRHKSRSPIKYRAKPAAPAMAGKTLFELTNDSCRWLGN